MLGNELFSIALQVELYIISIPFACSYLKFSECNPTRLAKKQLEIVCNYDCYHGGHATVCVFYLQRHQVSKQILS